MISIHDCRRRSERYARLKDLLHRQRTRLSEVQLMSAKIAIVERTERILLEELHEWHYVVQEFHM
jgi:hypothetical protein